MAFPLEGIKVLDLTRALAGPYATRILSDLGADVVKVEPPDGDMTRLFGSKIGNLSSHFTQHNAGKRNVCVDLGAEGASELILELAEVADVLVENFRPGVMDKYGLGWETIHARNPRLTMLSISGFGQEGPERDRAAYAPVVHAETGLIDRFSEVHGHKGGDFPLSVADTTASVHGTIGVLSALFMTQRTGVGQHIDLAMINAQFYNDDYLSMMISGDRLLAGGGDVWEVPGGRIMIASPPKILWKMLQSDLGGAPDPGNDDERTETLAPFFASLPTWEAVTELLDKHRVPWGRVRSHKDAYATSPSVGPRQILTEIDDRVGGTRLTTQAPYHFSDAEASVQGPAAYRGEHNHEVLAEWLGQSAATTDVLVEAGVLLRQDPATDKK